MSRFSCVLVALVAVVACQAAAQDFGPPGGYGPMAAAGPMPDYGLPAGYGPSEAYGLGGGYAAAPAYGPAVGYAPPGYAPPSFAPPGYAPPGFGPFPGYGPAGPVPFIPGYGPVIGVGAMEGPMPPPVGSMPAAPGQGGSFFDSCVRCSPYYVQGELLYMLRDNRTSVVSVIRVLGEGTGFPGATVLTSGAPEFNMEPGARVLLGWQMNACNALELSYFGIFDWTATAVATGENELAIPGDLGLASLNFFAADRMVLDYNAELHNVELNFFHAWNQVSWLAGLRYVTINEEFNIRSTDSDTGTSNYNIRTDNDLYGAQIGLRFQHCRGRWHWNFTGKAGLYWNDASQTQFVTDFPPGFFLRDPVSDNKENVAFVGDLNLSATRQFNNVWALRGGYSLIWIEGLALAPNQLDFTDTPDSGSVIDSKGGIFMHGVNIGLEARW
jgi:hypothetical protein